MSWKQVAKSLVEDPPEVQQVAFKNFPRIIWANEKVNRDINKLVEDEIIKRIKTRFGDAAIYKEKFLKFDDGGQDF